MSSEFSTAVNAYLQSLSLKFPDFSKDQSHVISKETSKRKRETPEKDSSSKKIENDIDIDAIQKGVQFSSLGPLEYKGDILENPDLLWTEDKWDSDKEVQALKRINEQGENVSNYWKSHYESLAGRYWHDFYKRNQDHFYKDRHYLHIVFPELASYHASSFTNASPSSSEQIQNENRSYLLEVGCGVGNAAIPLLDINPNLNVVAIDFAKSAIEILQDHIKSMHIEHRMRAHVCNVVDDVLPIDSNSMDMILCMFVLSAISPAYHKAVLEKLFNGLKKGGKLFFRDYGRFDEAQLRFKKGSKLDDNFYVRQDGTCSYFFSVEEFTILAQSVGFIIEEAYPIQRQYANRQQKKARYRVWIHAKFIKP